MNILRLTVALLMALGVAACAAPNPYGYSSGASSSYSAQPTATPTHSPGGY